jgi:hypothetical protein
MQTTLALAALAAVAYAIPQGVTTNITPTSSAPAGFSPDYSGQFEISIYKTSAKRSLTEVCCPQSLIMSILTYISVLPPADNRAISPSHLLGVNSKTPKAEPDTSQPTTNSSSMLLLKPEPSTLVVSLSVQTVLSLSVAQLSSTNV